MSSWEGRTGGTVLIWASGGKQESQAEPLLGAPFPAPQPRPQAWEVAAGAQAKPRGGREAHPVLTSMVWSPLWRHSPGHTASRLPGHKHSPRGLHSSSLSVLSPSVLSSMGRARCCVPIPSPQKDAEKLHQGREIEHQGESFETTHTGCPFL